MQAQYVKAAAGQGHFGAAPTENKIFAIMKDRRGPGRPLGNARHKYPTRQYSLFSGHDCAGGDHSGGDSADQIEHLSISSVTFYHF